MKWYDKPWFAVLMLIVFFPVGIYLMWRNDHFKKWVRIGVTAFFVLLLMAGLTSDDTEEDGSIADDGVQEVEMEVVADMDVKIEEDKLVVDIDTNAIDGSIFEFFVMDGDLNTISDFITVEDGLASGSFETHEDWDVGYLGTGGFMRFNYEEREQPSHVKEAYGEFGENIKGDYRVENNKDGYNVNVKSGQVAYPNETEASEKANELLLSGLNELIESSEGIILGMNPAFEDNDWTAVNIKVSDAWYNSQEHEKERFAETMADATKNIIYSSGFVGKDKLITVYFYDSYNKELASPKIMGGYKIKR